MCFVWVFMRVGSTPPVMYIQKLALEAVSGGGCSGPFLSGIAAL